MWLTIRVTMTHSSLSLAVWTICRSSRCRLGASSILREQFNYTFMLLAYSTDGIPADAAVAKSKRLMLGGMLNWCHRAGWLAGLMKRNSILFPNNGELSPHTANENKIKVEMMKIVLFFPFSCCRVSPVEWEMAAYYIPRLMNFQNRKGHKTRRCINFNHSFEMGLKHFQFHASKEEF